jgi:hypothetical protein
VKPCIRSLRSVGADLGSKSRLTLVGDLVVAFRSMKGRLLEGKESVLWDGLATVFQPH